MLENTLELGGIDGTIGYTSKARLVAGASGVAYKSGWCWVADTAGMAAQYSVQSSLVGDEWLT
jgi:hypothetical protein